MGGGTGTARVVVGISIMVMEDIHAKAHSRPVALTTRPRVAVDMVDMVVIAWAVLAQAPKVRAVGFCAQERQPVLAEALPTAAPWTLTRARPQRPQDARLWISLTGAVNASIQAVSIALKSRMKTPALQRDAPRYTTNLRKTRRKYATA